MDEAASLKLEVAELEQNRRHLAAAYAATRVLTESATLREATPRILQTICETLSWEYGALWAVDKQAGGIARGPDEAVELIQNQRNRAHT